MCSYQSTPQGSVGQLVVLASSYGYWLAVWLVAISGAVVLGTNAGAEQLGDPTGPTRIGKCRVDFEAQILLPAVISAKPSER